MLTADSSEYYILKSEWASNSSPFTLKFINLP